MKLFFIFFVLSFYSLNAQNYQTADVKELLVVDIIIHKNAYEILAIENRVDTIRILSQKEKVNDRCKFVKIKKGKIYKFQLSATPSTYDNLVVRLGNEVFWKSGDDIKYYPYFAINVIDKYIVLL